MCLAGVGLDVGHGTVFLSQVQAELTLVSKTQLTGLTLRTEKTHINIHCVLINIHHALIKTNL